MTADFVFLRYPNLRNLVVAALKALKEAEKKEPKIEIEVRIQKYVSALIYTCPYERCQPRRGQLRPGMAEV